MRESETEEHLREVVSVRYAVLRWAEIVGKRYNEASLVIKDIETLTNREYPLSKK